LGVDGSSPLLADNTAHTVRAAARLFARADRPKGVEAVALSWHALLARIREKRPAPA